MTIVFHVNKSENNKLTKSLTNIVTLSGTLRQGTSIIDPVINVEASLSTLKNCNYMTIAAFGRSYFVTNIKSVQNGIVEITGHVDVLSSFASEIKGNSAIVARNEKHYNLYVDDGVFTTYSNPDVRTIAFNGFNTQEIILAVAGYGG